MPKVNRDYLFRYNVCLPSVKEQARLAAKLDIVSAETIHLVNVYNQKLARLIELKKAVLRKAFAGKLTLEYVKGAQEAAE